MYLEGLLPDSAVYSLVERAAQVTTRVIRNHSPLLSERWIEQLFHACLPACLPACNPYPKPQPINSVVLAVDITILHDPEYLIVGKIALRLDLAYKMRPYTDFCTSQLTLLRVCGKGVLCMG